MATFIIVQNLKANKYVIHQYAITNIYMSAKNIKRHKLITHIWYEVQLVEKLKANMLVDIDIMTT